MRTSVLLILGLSLAVGGCSDENKPPDGKDLAVTDQSLTADGTVDAPKDSAVDKVLNLDGLKDGARDQAQGDVARDMISGPDGPPPILSGTITRTVTPIFDGRGTIYVGIMNALVDPPTKLAGADLSQPGSSVRYAIYNAVPGDYELWAFLDDNGNAGPFLFADPGDLVTSAVINITIGTTPMVHDLVLDQVQGAAADAGVGEAAMAIGSIRGKITRSVAPLLDGGGTLYITLHASLPPGDQVAVTSMAAVDLSSPYASETYFLGSVAPGKYYLQAFLDDNDNAFLFTPAPDKDDLSHSKPVQVHVVGGVVNEQDVVLDMVVP